MVLTWLLLWGFGGTDGGREAVRGARVLFPFAIVGRTWCSLLGPKCSCFHGMLCRFFGDFPEDFALTIPRCGRGGIWLAACHPKPLSQKVCMCGCCLTLAGRPCTGPSGHQQPAPPQPPVPRVVHSISGLSFPHRVQYTLCILKFRGPTLKA